MSDSDQNKLPAKGQFLVYMAEDGRTKLEVRLENETVWLAQQHIAELFQTTVPNVSMHLRNIYAEGELQPTATIKEFLIVRQEGKRQVSRTVDHYNLDAIISVGYRVKSAVATRFRIWATQKLREFIVKGFVLKRVGRNEAWWRCWGREDNSQARKAHGRAVRNYIEQAHLRGGLRAGDRGSVGMLGNCDSYFYPD